MGKQSRPEPTAEAAAERLGVTAKQVEKLVRVGKLKREAGGQYMLVYDTDTKAFTPVAPTLKEAFDAVKLVVIPKGEAADDAELKAGVEAVLRDVGFPVENLETPITPTAGLKVKNTDELEALLRGVAKPHQARLSFQGFRRVGADNL